ncbi:MAG: protein-export chaperone SecB [Gammaproteobacteria bacterium]|nr:protein-export chaperone SecB [Gammaproteobacteria bacterium]
MAQSDSAAGADGGVAEESQQGRFAIQQIYVKDLSFESPHAPMVFREQWKPDVQMQLDTSASKLEDDLYEVVLTITVTAKAADKTAFLIETQQAGIFQISNFSEEEMGPILGSTCPGVLYPYAREAISTTSVRGGFPPLLLAAANFDALYQLKLRQVLEQRQAENGSEQGSE